MRFAGDGFVALDRSNYGDMEDELEVGLRFRPDAADGVLLMAGAEAEGDFVALQMRGQFLEYR